MQNTTTQMNQEMQECINNCLSCHAVCLETISHCLQMGGRHAEASHIRLLQDCVQICLTSADFMLRGSNFHGQTCGVCADVCERCADECESMADGNDFMARCAEECRRCAESCRRMASGTSTSASV
jgi:hypothetical protein